MKSKDLHINKVFDKNRSWLSAIPDFTLVVSCYNKRNVISQCLELIKASCIKLHRIIVIDDGSTDNSSDAIRRVDGVELIVNAANKGWGLSNNRALQEVCSKYIVFFDADYLIGTYGWLESWYLFSIGRDFGESGELHYCSTLWDMLLPDGSSFYSYMMKMSWLLDDKVSIGIRHRDSSKSITEHIGGNFKIFNTNLLKSVGGFVTGSSPCCTEVEISLRIKSLGYSLLPYRIPKRWTTSVTDSPDEINHYFTDMHESIFNQKKMYEEIGGLVFLPENYSTIPTCYRC